MKWAKMCLVTLQKSLEYLIQISISLVHPVIFRMYQSLTTAQILAPPTMCQCHGCPLFRRKRKLKEGRSRKFAVK
jgi:hypothetical protein